MGEPGVVLSPVAVVVMGFVVSVPVGAMTVVVGVVLGAVAVVPALK